MMMLRTPRHLLAVVPVVLMTACAEHAAPQPNSSGPFIRGTAKVVSVEPTIGHATLDIGGGKMVDAYWQTEWATPQGGSTVQQDVNKPPVGIYRPPTVQASTFQAKPGDTIGFVGMQTGNSIFLQGISVITP